MSGFGNFSFGISAFGMTGNDAGSESTYIQPTVILGSYLYRQYANDPALNAFVGAYNSLAQGYLDWFIATPMAVYTSDSISGPLLDWIGNGLYGIARPIISNLSARTYVSLNAFPLNFMALNSRKRISSGSATLASDDIYKRTLTWWLYRGDGKQMSIDWLKRRVMRFLAGTNGTDVAYPPVARASITVAAGAFTITVPTSADSQTFKQLLNQGALALPFMYSFSVTLT